MMSAMVYAAQLSSVEMAALLLSAGADVDLTALEYIVGTKVTANYLNRGKWLPGVISAVRDDRYEITFADGNTETLKKERIKLVDQDGMLIVD